MQTTKIKDNKFNFGDELAILEHLANLYPEPLSAFNQVIQNAHDNNASVVKVAVLKDRKSLVVMYNGDPIRRSDLDYIRDHVGKSKNANNPDKIGQFGTGFITFLRYANKQTIIGYDDNGDEIVWTIEPNRESRYLSSKDRKMQDSERNMDSKYPFIKMFRKEFGKHGVYILIENFNKGQIDAFAGARLGTYLTDQWIECIIDTSNCLNRLYYYVTRKGSGRSIPKWKEIKSTKIPGEPFKCEVFGTHNDKDGHHKIKVKFDLVVSTKYDAGVKISNKGQPICDITKLNKLSKKSIFRDPCVNGTIKINCDDLITSGRDYIDEYHPKGTALINAINCIDDEVREVVQSALNKEVNKKLQKDNVRLTEQLQEFCGYIGFHKKTSNGLVKSSSSSSSSSRKEKSLYDMNQQMRNQQNATINGDSPRKQQRGVGLTVRIERFLPEQDHLQYKMHGDVVLINKNHLDYKLLEKKEPRTGVMLNYRWMCIILALAPMTKHPEQPESQEIGRLFAQYLHWK